MTKAALYRYARRRGRRPGDFEAWSEGIKRALKYYDEHDPMRARLMRIRYFERRTEEETIKRLNVGRTTYQKAHCDVLSTVALYAAGQGANV